MTMFFTLNQNPTNYVGSVALMVHTMVKAGWLVLSWSDGVVAGGTVNGSPGAGFLGFRTGSDNLPIITAGTGTLNNDRAWVLVQQPIGPSGTPVPYSGSRQFIFQRSTAGTSQWRVKYSFSGGYFPVPGTTGTLFITPGINPVVADEVILRGGGTDTGPSFDGLMPAAGEGQNRVNCMADDGTSGSSTPYGFMMFAIPAGGGSLSHAFLFDPMVIGSCASGTRDPYVIYIGSSGSSVFAGTLTLASNTFLSENNGYLSPQSWLRVGRTQSAFTQFAACVWGCIGIGGGPSVAFIQSWPNQMGGNSYTTYDDLMPIIYAREAVLGGATGYKGVSSFLKWNANLHQSGETLSISDPGTTRDRIVLDDVNGPWDLVTVPLI